MKNLEFKQYMQVGDNQFAPLEFTDYGKEFKIVHERVFMGTMAALIKENPHINIIWRGNVRVYENFKGF